MREHAPSKAKPTASATGQPTRHTEPGPGNTLERVTALLATGDVKGGAELLEADLDRSPGKLELRRRGALELWQMGQRARAVSIVDGHFRSEPADAELARLSALMHAELAEDGPNVTRSGSMVTYSSSSDEAKDQRWVDAHREAATKMAAIYHGLRPNEADAVRVYSDMLLARQAFDQAVEVLETAKSLTYGDAALLERLGRALTALSRGPDAVRALEQALVLSPKAPSLFDALRLAAEQAGRLELAQEAEQKRRFFAFLVPGHALDFNSGRAAQATVLASHASDGHAAAVDRLLKELSADESEAATELLVAFAKLHSHDDREERAFAILRARGRRAQSAVLRLAHHGDGLCTIRQALDLLTEQHAVEALPLMLKLLPQDTNGPFPMNAAYGVALLGGQHVISSLLEVVQASPPAHLDSMRVIGFETNRTRAALAIALIGGEPARTALASARKNGGSRDDVRLAECTLHLDDAHCARLGEFLSANPFTASLLTDALARSSDPRAKKWRERFEPRDED